ncbi:MAG: DNA gyrase inhibitor YacG [Rhodobacteraceae bacterium]|jgi:endogenous inhibitor of DNA gyrase (YacG/DUF329 family)|nr:DNA gyrase inhibitor YacG [Paracoccaceae bacterium]
MSRPCPVCGRPAEARFRPFCSRRCADVDLGRWLTGRYAIPAALEEEGAVPSAPPGPAAAGGPGGREEG